MLWKDNFSKKSIDKEVFRHYPFAGLDKIKTFRDRSLNFSKLSVKVRKLRQQNLRQKVWNLWNQESEIKLILFLVLKFLSS